MNRKIRRNEKKKGSKNDKGVKIYKERYYDAITKEGDIYRIQTKGKKYKKYRNSQVNHGKYYALTTLEGMYMNVGRNQVCFVKVKFCLYLKMMGGTPL